jgi:hypothetical protein
MKRNKPDVITITLWTMTITGFIGLGIIGYKLMQYDC